MPAAAVAKDAISSAVGGGWSVTGGAASVELAAIVPSVRLEFGRGSKVEAAPLAEPCTLSSVWSTGRPVTWPLASMGLDLAATLST